MGHPCIEGFPYKKKSTASYFKNNERDKPYRIKIDVSKRFNYKFC